MMSFKEFSAKVKEDARLSDLIERYSDRNDSITDDELSEMVERSAQIYDENDPDLDDDYPEDMWNEDWDALELGFNPYMGCYSDDC